MSDKYTLDAADRRRLMAHPSGWLGTGLGSGLAPKAQGTVGSAVAILPWLALRELSWPVYLLVLVVAFAIGVWACDVCGRRLGVADHRSLVWDEFVGQWIALWPAIFAPWWAVLAGFVLFRIFDVAKPWPIGWLDARVKGGMGVMIDDVIAGMFAALLLALGLYLLH
ncbi:phosphatidylglycerophosphatase A [Oleiagrimonas sp. C23AA]|uniref:phosphatidylglycerophosphatase A family protein n=1 Tax=Oleiagrimonas sp. C23AA TaxID=2719047 RepID=UPI001422E900|nr:phosphatidylglycerophosphatase A [Oleiagrimonas sp. C23AA]NII12050.1 phosphatidylglycerophosphatase A [Oleiagrimonas sp. C23AA]